MTVYRLRAVCGVQASVFGMEMRGTHAHSFVVSFYSLSDLKDKTLVDVSGVRRDFASVVLQYRAELKRMHTHEGEITAFISYAQAFPSGFLGLLDTFDTLESGIWNFICVALALHQVTAPSCMRSSERAGPERCAAATVLMACCLVRVVPCAVRVSSGGHSSGQRRLGLPVARVSQDLCASGRHLPNRLLCSHDHCGIE
jgi:hypothetical protein